MKNERRHKLSQNDLAQIIENYVNTIKDHSVTIMRAIMFVLIAVLLFLIWRYFASGNMAVFHNDLKQLVAYNVSALSAEDFDKIILEYTTKYPSGENNARVSLVIGDIYINRASVALAEGNREQAIANYEAALKYYSTADKFPFKKQEQEFAERAVWGFAQTNEALAALKEGEYLAAAKDAYERLCKTWPNSEHRENAAWQLAWLNRPVVGTFPAQYRQADPILFAPRMQTPETTSPAGLDTTILPGGDVDLDSILKNLSARVSSPEASSGDAPVYDPGLPPVPPVEIQEETPTTPTESASEVEQPAE